MRSADEPVGSGLRELEAESTSADAPAFWLCSSGSTGSPKGCVHLQHDMLVCANSYARGVLGIASQDRCFSVAKSLPTASATRCTSVCRRRDQHSLARCGHAAGCLRPDRTLPADVVLPVPTHFAMMLAHHREGRDFDLSSIRSAVSAGEALLPVVHTRFRERFGVEILDGIGSTEVLHIFISNRPGQSRWLAGDWFPATTQIVDEQGAAASGATGELLIRGDSTWRKYYWNRHEKTKETIVGHWIRTAITTGRTRKAFWFAGRSDDMLKVGGQWVSPAELEQTLVEHPDVSACGVAGCADRDGLIKPIAYVVVRDGVEATPELAATLRQFARERLADYNGRGVEFVQVLPMTSTGKVQRFKLRQRAAHQREAP